MNYYGAWLILESVVRMALKTRAPNLSALYIRYRRLDRRSSYARLHTMSEQEQTSVYRLMDSVQDMILAAHNCNCKYCNTPIEPTQPMYSNLLVCEICHEESEQRHIEQMLYDEVL